MVKFSAVCITRKVSTYLQYVLGRCGSAPTDPLTQHHHHHPNPEQGIVVHVCYIKALDQALVQDGYISAPPIATTTTPAVMKNNNLTHRFRTRT